MDGAGWLLALVVFVAMEPLTALVHRKVMHGFGMGWHRSHHRRRQGRFEANDLYPVTFASLTIVAMALGTWVEGLGLLLPVGVGVTAYGMSYAVVHELVIHRRVPVVAGTVDRLARRTPLLDRWVDAHALHHRFGGAPYGMLWPRVPAEVRTRAERASSTPASRRAALRNEAAEAPSPPARVTSAA